MIEDVLIGSSTVIVKRSNADDLEFETDGKTVELPLGVDAEVVDALENHNLEINREAENTFTFYVHDDASPSDYDRVAEHLGISDGRENDIVEAIAGIGYEIPLEIKVSRTSVSWNAHVTEVFGIPLEEPKKIY